MVIGPQGVSLWELGHSEPLCGIALAAHFAVNNKLFLSQWSYMFLSVCEYKTLTRLSGCL